MYIKRIELQDFRNYAKLEASFSEKVNISSEIMLRGRQIFWKAYI